MAGDLNVAVVGAGYWGPNLMRTFAGLEGCRLAWACDLDVGRLEAVQARHAGVAATTCLDDLLTDASLQAVAIATPAATHYRLARRCLLADKHVLMEKPFVLDAAEGEELIGLARERGLTLMVDHIFLYNPAFARLCRLVHEGRLGALRYVQALRTSLGPRLCEDTNVVWDAQIHEVYMAMELLQELPVRVVANGGAFVRQNTEDVVFSTLYFPSGALVHCHNTSYAPRKERRWIVVGSAQMAIYDDMKEDGRLVVCKRGFVPSEGTDALGNRGIRLFDEGEEKVEVGQQQSLTLECAHFLDCIRSGKRPLSDGVSALRVLRVLEAIDRSLQAGGEEVALQAPSAWPLIDRPQQNEEVML